MTDKFGKEICEGDIVYFAFSETGRVAEGRVVEIINNNCAEVLSDISTTPFTVRKELIIRSHRNNNN